MGLFHVQSPDCVSVGLVPQLLEPRHLVLLDWDLTWEAVIRYQDKLFPGESNISQILNCPERLWISIPGGVQGSAGHGHEHPS